MTELLTGIGQVTDMHAVKCLMVVLACAGRLDLGQMGRGLMIAGMLALGHGLWVLMSWFSVGDAFGSWSYILLPIVASMCVIWNVNQSNHGRAANAGMWIISLIIGALLSIAIGFPVTQAEEVEPDVWTSTVMFWLGISVGLALMTTVVLSIGSLMRGLRIAQRDQGFLICGGVLFQAVLMLVQELL